MSEEAPVSEQPQQSQEPEAAAPAPSQTTAEQPPPPQQNEEEVKSKPAPAPAPAPAPEFGSVKQGFIQRQGLLWKSWYRQWMTLDEGGAALRWYKTEQRTGNDGTLYMSKCAEVCEPKEGITTNWPDEAEGRTFVICSPNRAHYIIADSVEDKMDWIEKLNEARNKFSSSKVKIISVDLFSVEAVKVSLSAEMERARGETDSALAAEGTSTDQIGQDLDKAVKDAEKEVKKETAAPQQEEVVTEKVEAEVSVVAESGGGEVEVKIEASAAASEAVVTTEVSGTAGPEAQTEVVETEAQTEVVVKTTDEEQAVQETSEEKDAPPAEDAGKEE